MAPQQPGAMAPINSKVAAAISGLFGQSKGADCRLVFVLDPAPPTGEPGDGSTGGRQGAQVQGAKQVLGEPLPAHSFVLRYASDKIAAQLEWAETGGADGACDPHGRPSKKVRTSGAATAESAAPEKQLPEVQLMLGGEEELPAARAAIQFAYTGRVEAGISVREALQVCRQATYLQLDGCVEACLEVVKEALVQGSAAPAAAGSGSGSGSGNATAGAASAAGPTFPVLELYGCTALWPDPAEDAAFAALLAEAKRRLVAHFGDALAVLNDTARYEQMVALPAVGLAALLESDDFGTDSESSVVLVLAEWMAFNYDSTDEALRRRLCGRLRLVQCSPVYLSGVLPALAARHQRSPTSAAGWLPVTVAEAFSMLTYSTASEPARTAMVAKGHLWGLRAGRATMPAGWRNTQPRRQCLSAEGRPFDFSTSLAEIEQSFGALQPGVRGRVYPRVLGSRLGSHIVAQGLEWRPNIDWASGAATAGVFVTPLVPSALAATAAFGGPAWEDELLTEAVVAFPPMRVSVRGAAGRQAWEFQLGVGDKFVRMARGLGQREALKLHEATDDQQPNASNSKSKLAARWAPYLQDGTRLEGSIALLPPAS
ncbi:hypothetical protein HXX76_013428 [Chlamydomonas incerta]|uniref:BACK domain-containing protein n=1 Tax=Chlamydomonas incerta TaxID=51695 RepID=A0A835VU01_CHLIN|nr:hypothetical protein HXX76_013428 [Chlamydomonas incerta]|eukprot:KAG2425803.1 hypothetical protein HXX76_013428 [Chlamydomonas incerta]